MRKHLFGMKGAKKAVSKKAVLFTISTYILLISIFPLLDAVQLRSDALQASELYGSGLHGVLFAQEDIASAFLGISGVEKYYGWSNQNTRGFYVQGNVQLIPETTWDQDLQNYISFYQTNISPLNNVNMQWDSPTYQFKIEPFNTTWTIVNNNLSIKTELYDAIKEIDIVLNFSGDAIRENNWVSDPIKYPRIRVTYQDDVDGVSSVVHALDPTKHHSVLNISDMYIYFGSAGGDGTFWVSGITANISEINIGFDEMSGVAQVVSNEQVSIQLGAVALNRSLVISTI